MKNKHKPSTEEAMKQEMTDSELEHTPVEAIDPESIQEEAEANENQTEKDPITEILESIRAKDQEIASLKDRVLRSAAEFDNFRRRSNQEKLQSYERGVKDITLAILPVIDNFDRALQYVKEEEAGSSIVQGIKMVQKQMVSALAEMGVTEIPALGSAADYNLHEVISHIEDPNHGENEIVNVVEKGYQYREAVIRHSKVIVAN